MFLIESRIQSLLNNDYFWPLGVLIIINGKPLKDCSTKNYVILKSHGFCSFNFATEITLKSFLFHRKSCFLQIFPHCVFLTLSLFSPEPKLFSFPVISLLLYYFEKSHWKCHSLIMGHLCALQNHEF